MKSELDEIKKYEMIVTMHEVLIDGLVQDCSDSIVNTLELLQSYTKPSKSSVIKSGLIITWLCHSRRSLVNRLTHDPTPQKNKK